MHLSKFPSGETTKQYLIPEQSDILASASLIKNMNVQSWLEDVLKVATTLSGCSLEEQREHWAGSHPGFQCLLSQSLASYL